MLEEWKEQRYHEQLFRDFAGLYLRDLDYALRVVIGAENKDVPSYIKAVHPAGIKKDNRTAAEIKQHVIDMLKGR